MYRGTSRPCKSSAPTVTFNGDRLNMRCNVECMCQGQYSISMLKRNHILSLKTGAKTLMLHFYNLYSDSISLWTVSLLIISFDCNSICKEFKLFSIIINSILIFANIWLNKHEEDYAVFHLYSLCFPSWIVTKSGKTRFIVEQTVHIYVPRSAFSIYMYL